jgi:predicted nucleotidyltransferase
MIRCPIEFPPPGRDGAEGEGEIVSVNHRIADALGEWASKHEAVAVLWLFGSRARGSARPESDYDIALELMPKRGRDDWAFTQYFFSRDEWKSEIKGIVQGDVSLVCFREDRRRRRIASSQVGAGRQAHLHDDLPLIAER